MAGSLSHITDEDGRFRMDLIENLGDAHEALVECHQLLAAFARRWGGDRLIMDECRSMGFPTPTAIPVVQPELHGAASVYRAKET